jgi:hypothetical protein
LGDTGIDKRIILKHVSENDVSMRSVMKWLRIDSEFCNDHDKFLGSTTAGIVCNCRILTQDSVRVSSVTP